MMKILRENKVLTEDAESAVDKIVDYLKSLSESDLVSIWNDYCDETGYTDDRIESFDEDTINELFDSPYEAMRAAFFGDVSFNHDWFKLNGYGNIETGYADDLADIDTLADYCVTNDEDFGDFDIRGILDEDEDEDEE